MNNDLIRKTVPEATHRLVLLHGWGADADDLIPLGEKLKGEVGAINFEIVSLRAPEQHPEGYGRQWYGLFPPDWDAVPKAVNELKQRLKDVCGIGIPLEKTILLGFSQGGAMAVAAGSELSIAGLIACSGYPHPEWMPPAKSAPVLLCHGKNDDVVPCEASRKLINIFRKNNTQADLLLFNGGHEIDEKLIPKMRKTIHSWLI
tara:strand:- start:631 stop:1239 length:609 start_codon:yes stop_codon:yes gene_type:complete